MRITMLGVGNGFSSGVYDNNALLEDSTESCMLDCGTTAWWSLDQLKRKREEISAIFLTHLHFDHSGGVESAALYGQYVSGRKMKLIVPKPIKDTLWEHVLKGTIENRSAGLTGLSDYFEVITPEEGEKFLLCGNISAYWFPTKHVAGKFSCGLVINDKILYTSDMINDLDLLLEMDKLGIQYFFHDCQLKGALVHAEFDAMKTYPEHIRKKIYLMHHGLLDHSQAPEACGMHFLFQHHEINISS